ncbi:fasciclin-1 isoform X3 [Aedes aegypti]|uniref:FAS1 domain-containing protein n=1 Tax=Aedes aegypti TaxID=7159 RepID=A0A6I8TNL8_AEDAE|nr:fasciclin-1 isoform X3 [Aedes aegypti]
MKISSKWFSGGGGGGLTGSTTTACAALLLMVLTTMMTPMVASRTPIAMTLEEHISNDPDLSQFFDLIERNPIASSNLKLRSLTIFAPTNQAFQRYLGNKTLVQYHMSNVATTLEQLGPTITSDYDGNPPIYVTRKRQPNGSEDVYVNNAKIIRSRSNVQLSNQYGKKQVLHIIDDVLTPLTVNPSTSFEIYNPDAYQFILHAENMDISQHRIRSFRHKMTMAKKEDIYRAVGGHTFLIPVEEGFKPPPRPDMIDRKVIDGHVIPNRVIFTAPAPLDDPLETLAFEDNLKVTVTFFKQGDGKNAKVYVRSNTVIGDSKHASGAVLAEIVKANIPVRNGVVHLIHRPLMVVDTTVLQFLEHFKTHDIDSHETDDEYLGKPRKEKEDGPLFKFYELIADYAPDFFKTMSNLQQMTLFAPSNEALSHPIVNNFIRSREKLREILNLHLVRDSITTDKIRKNNQNQIYQVPTGADKKFLYFNIITNRYDHNQTITVEGGGVNATIILSDIAATNGYLHIIDRVLGIPYMTVQEKIETDPMLNLTYQFGRLNHFNEQLNKTTKRFTYFIPRDKAWMQWFHDHQGANLNDFLFDRDQSRSVLERHLVVADRVFTMTDLKNMSNDSLILPTVGPHNLQIRVKEEDRTFIFVKSHRMTLGTAEDDYSSSLQSGFFIQWRETNKWIPVFRPDVECTNGVIHVIDAPLVRDHDITTSGSSSSSISSFVTTMVITVANTVLLAALAFL